MASVSSLTPAATAPPQAHVPHVPIPRRGVDYRGKVVLAPMVRSGECPSRLLALHYGADLVWGPETVDKALIGTTRRENPRTNTIDFTRAPSHGVANPNLTPEQRESVIYRLHPAREGSRLIFQLGTATPENAVAAATLVAPDVAGIDVNAGCPKPFSTSGGMGAALLQDPDRLCAILRALVKHVGAPFEIGISVKIRLLADPAATLALVTALCATGITGLTVHCRTTPMRPREPAIRGQLRDVVSTCRAAGVACLMNGDVGSRADALRLCAEYGADGAMLATAAEANPSVFQSEHATAPWHEVAARYLTTALAVDNRFGNTKFSLSQLIPGKQPAYNAVAKCHSYSAIAEALVCNEDIRARAADVDRVLALGAFEPPRLTKAERKAANKAAATATGKEDNTEEVENHVGGVKRSADRAELDDPLPREGNAPSAKLHQQQQQNLSAVAV